MLAVGTKTLKLKQPCTKIRRTINKSISQLKIISISVTINIRSCSQHRLSAPFVFLAAMVNPKAWLKNPRSCGHQDILTLQYLRTILIIMFYCYVVLQWNTNCCILCCRVNYSPELWLRLVTASKNVNVSSAAYLADLDLSGLIIDSFALADAEVLPLATFLDLTTALPLRIAMENQESIRLSWEAAAAPLTKLFRSLGVEDGECRSQMHAFVTNKLLGPFLEATKLDLFTVLETESFELRQLRVTLAHLRALPSGYQRLYICQMVDVARTLFNVMYIYI